MSFFEAGMLICFGSAWPFAIYRTWKSRSNHGKSVHFLWILELGYLLGMIHKVLYSRDVVFFLYLMNFLMVGTDMIFFYRNERIEKMHKKDLS